MTERAAQARVGDGDRFVPVEPTHVLTLVRGRARVAVHAGEEVPQVEMGVALRPWVDVDVHEHRAAAGETGLLDDLTHGRLLRRLACVDVSSGLQPQAETAVQMQEDATRTGDDRRRGHVRRVGVFVERPVQSVELGEEAALRLRLPFIDKR